MKKIKEIWEGLPDIAKVIVIIILVLIALRILNGLKSFVQTFVQGSTNQGAIGAYQAQGEQASYSDAEYKAMADRLDDAMRGAGTNYDEVYAVMDKLQNNIDAIKLNQAFGIREYTLIWTFRAGLLEWLEGDLSASRMDMLWDSLETKGITYRFT